MVQLGNQSEINQRLTSKILSVSVLMCADFSFRCRFESSSSNVQFLFFFFNLKKASLSLRLSIVTSQRSDVNILAFEELILLVVSVQKIQTNEACISQ